MLKIRAPNLDLLAIVPNYFGASINEAINAEYVFTCTMVVDEKSDYVVMGNIIEVEDQYFSIVHYNREHTQSGELYVQVDCEQVSYELIDDELDDFVHAGTPAALLALLLGGTNFTVGSVEPADIISVNINEVTNKRAVLMEIANLSGEMKYDKYTVHLLNQRGQDRGVQFRYGKNLLGINMDVDRRSGTTQTAYDINIVELNELEEFAGLEYFELGDTVQIINSELDINEPQRIVKYEYDPVMRINSRVTIANFIESIEDFITTVVRTTVVKDRLYYGTRIGPEVGFESIRSDKKARGIFNADTFALQKGDGSGSNWTNAVYFDTVEEEYIFTGVLEASSFVGGTIAIGSGNDIFKADSNGIYLGHETFSSAPFRVNMDGHMIAVGGEFSGEITASIITGGQINGGTITGALIQNQTAAGNKVYVDPTGFHANDSSGVERLTIGTTPAKGAKALVGRDASGVVSSIYTYDTEIVDGASRTGQYITAGGSYILVQLNGDIRIQNSSNSGFRAVGNTRPEINSGGGGWNGIAFKSEVDAKVNTATANASYGVNLTFDTGTRNLKMFAADGSTLATVNIP